MNNRKQAEAGATLFAIAVTLIVYLLWVQPEQAKYERELNRSADELSRVGQDALRRLDEER